MSKETKLGKRDLEENHPYEDEILKEYEDESEDPREYRREMKRIASQKAVKGMRRKDR